MAVAIDEPGAAEMEVLVRDEGSTIETDLCGNEVREVPPLSRAGPAVAPGRVRCSLTSSLVAVRRLLRSEPGRTGNDLVLTLSSS